MVDKTIGELPGISYLNSGSLFVAEQNGQAVKVSGKQLTDFSNVETAAQVEQAKVSAQVAQAAKESAEAAILKGPIIQNGTWWVYNQTTGAYQNTGINATGPQGIPGPTASVNGVTPDASGDVNVTASDVKMPDGTTTVKEAFDDMVHAVSQLVNPNLLDNWYFGNPINQRGFITTSIEEHTIDRWYAERYRTGTKSVTLNDGHVTISCDDSADGAYMDFVQYIESDISTYLVGKQITLSVLTKTGLYSRTFVPVDNSYHTFGINNECTVYFRARIKSTADTRIRCYNGNSVNLIAVKLELGSKQTLAHQDESGNWVLNEIPDYGEQLRRCQRYFVNFNPYKMSWFAMPPAVASAASQAYSAITLPVTMRAQPVVAYGGNIVLSQDADHAVTSILVSDNTFTGNSIQLRYDVSAGTLTANALYRVQGWNDPSSYIWLSADL